MNSTEYQKFLDENPAMKELANGGLVKLFGENGEKECPCDNCKKPLTVSTFSVFVTPNKPHRPLILCIGCTRIMAQKYKIDLGQSQMNLDGNHSVN